MAWIDALIRRDPQFGGGHVRPAIHEYTAELTPEKELDLLENASTLPIRRSWGGFARRHASRAWSIAGRFIA
jgi:hypothetical protein